MIGGKIAYAHTQGLEIVDGSYFATARQEDVQPKRALLLRTGPDRRSWDWWDVTPERPHPSAAATLTGDPVVPIMDHPGGLQYAVGRLWIPLAESRRTGRTLIRAYEVAALHPERTAVPAFEFAVADHLGALAVSSDGTKLLGANWDTEQVYVWNGRGELQRTISGDALAPWGLGANSRADGRPGIAVQDWKAMSGWLVGSGLRKATTSAESVLTFLPITLTGAGPAREFVLPAPAGTQLAREGMAIAGDLVHFLPEDLGATNRLYRLPLPVPGP